MEPEAPMRNEFENMRNEIENRVPDSLVEAASSLAGRRVSRRAALTWGLFLVAAVIVVIVVIISAAL
jgi:CHASE3 domain sensor protein